MGKNNLYDNIVLQAPDGENLSKVPAKRIAWYLSRNLVEKIDDKTFRLKFEPARRRKLPDWYMAEHKNICVVCGSINAEQLDKHHIIPICYRRHLDNSLKNNRCFDLQLVCKDCHHKYEVMADLFKKQLAIEANLPAPDKTSQELRRKIRLIRWILNATQNPNSDLPQTVFDKFLAEANSEHLDISQEGLDRLLLENQLIYEKHFADVVAHFGQEALIIRWRKHFIEYANPKFLEESWLRDIEVIE